MRFHQGRGPFVFDNSGSAYVDYILGYGPVVLGHASPEFNKIVYSVLDDGWHFPTYSPIHDDFVEGFFEEWEGDQGVMILRHSSDAVTAAIRLASYVTGRKGVIRCGYTGWHDTSIAGSPPWHDPVPFRQSKESKFLSAFYRGVTGDEWTVDWFDLTAPTLDAILSRYGVPAALVVDTYQLALGNQAEMRGAIDRVRAEGAVIVWDETKTANRVGRYGVAAQTLATNEDFTVLGKAVANGAALSMLVVPADLIPAVDVVRISGTFQKEIAPVAAALATMQVLSDRGGHPELHRVTDMTVRAFNNGV
ncbi:MAG: aminotransferase class III-fold pyridoxal phosphate-dependent enzyme [bacterium]|nr:aminotransferase class III-fold pyridoxal phosphate-dependent enzyme [bacterium]